VPDRTAGMASQGEGEEWCFWDQREEKGTSSASEGQHRTQERGRSAESKKKNGTWGKGASSGCLEKKTEVTLRKKLQEGIPCFKKEGPSKQKKKNPGTPPGGSPKEGKKSYEKKRVPPRKRLTKSFFLS